MRAVDVEIENPCAEDWDAMQIEAGGVRRFCERCQHAVHDLSGMVEDQAHAFLRGTEGQGVCIAYVEDEAGNIVFRPRPAPASVVPVVRVRRRSRATAVTSAASLAVVLSGCTPHGEPQRAIQLDDPDVASVVAPSTVIPDNQITEPLTTHSDELAAAAELPCEPRPERLRAKKGKRKRTAGVWVKRDPAL